MRRASVDVQRQHARWQELAEIASVILLEEGHIAGHGTSEELDSPDVGRVTLMPVIGCRDIEALEVVVASEGQQTKLPPGGHEPPARGQEGMVTCIDLEAG